MNVEWSNTNLGEIVRDLTAERTFSITPDKEVVDPTISSANHRISIAARSLGANVRVNKRVRILPGDLVFSRLHTQNGAFAFADQEFQATGTFVPLTVDESRVDRQFLYWALHVKVPTLSASDTVGRETYKTQDILALKIPLPPLAEQRRIVTRIEELSVKIAEARSLRHQATEEAEALSDSFLNSIFNSITASKNWRCCLLPEVADVARGKFAHRPRNEPRFYGGEFPFIQIGDISNSNRFIRSYSQTLNKDGLAISRLFPAGTVVIAITGATIGVTGILTFESCFPDSIVGIQAKPEHATPEFIYLVVEHAKSVALAEATQTTQPNINLGNLERLQVRVPPLSEQRRITAELDALHAKTDMLKHLQTETATELHAMLPAILDRAFKGEL